MRLLPTLKTVQIVRHPLGLFALLLALLIIAMVQTETARAQDEATTPTPADTENNATNDASGDDEKSAATAAVAPPVPRHNPNPSLWRKEDVSRFLTAFSRLEEVRVFGQEDAVSGLYLPENTGKPQGGVLILHDVEQHAHWPETVAPLREYLPDYGWNTLSLFMGNSIKAPLPPRPKPAPQAAPDTTQADASSADTTDEAQTSAPSTQPETSADLAPAPAPEVNTADAGGPSTASDELDAIADGLDSIPDLAAKAQAQAEEPEDDPDRGAQFIQINTDRVSAGITKLNEMGQFNLVIIAHGLNASWAVAALNEIYQRSPEAKGFALVLVDAKTPSYPQYPLNNMLANLDIPMLDLVTSQDPNDLRQAFDRRNALRRNQREAYQQIRIPAVRTAIKGKHNVLTRRVRGWLLTNAAGEEVQVKTKKP